MFLIWSKEYIEMKQRMMTVFNEWNKDGRFSGVFSVSGRDGVVAQQACGHRNKAEQLPNQVDTAFAIASGTKFFTGLAVCKLIDEGRLALADTLGDALHGALGTIDKSITIEQLLTHTSGVGDYIDEESPTCYEDMMALYSTYPVHLWENLSYYLQMSNHLPAKFAPGERYAYSNTGFVLLGLIVESVTGVSFQQYVTDAIIAPCGLKRTGFHRTNRLPANTALGYCYDECAQEWYANYFCVPIRGGSDGGLYTCAQDLDVLWRKVMNRQVLSEAMMGEFLKVRVAIDEARNRYYSLGMYQYKTADTSAYYAVGGDFGVEFFTVYFPTEGLVVSALGNTEHNTGPLLRKILENA